jgi:hypothetical protein
VVFVPIHTNLYTNCLVRIHTRCDFFILFLSLPAQAARNKLFGNTKRSSCFFIRIRISNWYKKVPSAKTLSEKNGLPPLPRYVGTCTIMYEKIVATIRKSGLYDLICVAYSQPLFALSYVGYEPASDDLGI